jgi:hypothetical protein
LLAKLSSSHIFVFSAILDLNHPNQRPNSDKTGKTSEMLGKLAGLMWNPITKKSSPSMDKAPKSSQFSHLEGVFKTRSIVNIVNIKLITQTSNAKFQHRVSL